MSSPFLRPLLWLGSRGGLFLTGVLIVVAGTWGFIVLTNDVKEGETSHFDRAVNRYFHDHPGPTTLQEAGRDLTSLGGVAVLTLMIAAVSGYLLLIRRYGMVALVIVATVGGLLLTVSLKHVIDRPRPPDRAASVVVYTQSFPSG